MTSVSSTGQMEVMGAESVQSFMFPAAEGKGEDGSSTASTTVENPMALRTRSTRSSFDVGRSVSLGSSISEGRTHSSDLAYCKTPSATAAKNGGRRAKRESNGAGVIGGDGGGQALAEAVLTEGNAAEERSDPLANQSDDFDVTLANPTLRSHTVKQREERFGGRRMSVKKSEYDCTSITGSESDIINIDICIALFHLHSSRPSPSLRPSHTRFLPPPLPPLPCKDFDVTPSMVHEDNLDGDDWGGQVEPLHPLRPVRDAPHSSEHGVTTVGPHGQHMIVSGSHGGSGDRSGDQLRSAAAIAGELKSDVATDGMVQDEKQGVDEGEWQTHLDEETNKWYYYHSATGETRWVE